MKIVGARGGHQSNVALSQNSKGVPFKCGTCEYFDRGICHNPNPAIHRKPVEAEWCCNLYDHAGMKVIR